MSTRPGPGLPYQPRARSPQHWQKQPPAGSTRSTPPKAPPPPRPQTPADPRTTQDIRADLIAALYRCAFFVQTGDIALVHQELKKVGAAYRRWEVAHQGGQAKT